MSARPVRTSSELYRDASQKPGIAIVLHESGSAVLDGSWTAGLAVRVATE
jgi:hypothetical protein